MLKIKYDDEDTNYSIHNVSAVVVSSEGGQGDNVKIVSLVAGEQTIQFRVWTDTRHTADQAAERLAQSVDENIDVSLYSERNYLYLNKADYPDERQMQVSGRITQNLTPKK